jgi:hypothetical protein
MQPQSPKQLKDDKTITPEELCVRIKGNIALLNSKLDEMVKLSVKK